VATNRDLASEGAQPLLSALVYEQFLCEGFHDDSAEEEKVTLIEFIRDERDQKLEEILPIQDLVNFTFSGG
jgi:hypothetical protein